MAAFKGNSEITALLLERGATVDITDNEGFTALMFAAHGGQDVTVELLLRAKANVNQGTVSGSNAALDSPPSRTSTRCCSDGAAAGTALHLASQCNYLKVVEHLVNHKADMSLMSKGLTPLHIAASKKHNAALVLMINAGVHYN